ncbi:MAG: phosphatase PAP2 family protein [Chloroflexi bacterium]|nr:phosphatase PAP2 family protein [Chloroflexota bacterium]
MRAFGGQKVGAWAPPLLTLGLLLPLAVSAHDGAPSLLDVPLAQAIQSVMPEPALGLFLLMNHLGQRGLVALYGGATVLALLLLRRRWEGLAVLVGLLFSMTNSLAKELVARPRPDADLVEVRASVGGQFGFPSGDTQLFTIFFGLLFVLAPRITSSAKLSLALRTLAGAMVALVGPARVALGVHWPSDVLGGYLLGGFILWGLMAVYRRLAG